MDHLLSRRIKPPRIWSFSRNNKNDTPAGLKQTSKFWQLLFSYHFLGYKDNLTPEQWFECPNGDCPLGKLRISRGGFVDTQCAVCGLSGDIGFFQCDLRPNVGVVVSRDSLLVVALEWIGKMVS